MGRIAISPIHGIIDGLSVLFIKDQRTFNPLFTSFIQNFSIPACGKEESAGQ
jgi:hypothetical protein